MDVPSVLAPEWRVGALSVRNVRPGEAGLVETLHKSRAAVAGVDPSFAPCDTTV